MATQFKIHPAIGIARLGNSPSEFCISPETPGSLPIACDADGNTSSDPQQGEATIGQAFWDAEGRIKRQAARFRVYAYAEGSAQGEELRIGQGLEVVLQHSGQVLGGSLVDIEWSAYLANKKASWYQFDQTNGEHGYAPEHPLRNADITDVNRRRKLIIDPGPQTVSHVDTAKRRASFAQGQNPGYAQSYPPSLQPNSIDSLGDLLAVQQDGHGRLLVLGGFGNSGSVDSGLGQPYISTFANNDGWFDDTSDGYVTANLRLKVDTVNGKKPPVDFGERVIPVDESAWVIVGYPRYVPQLQDIITLDDAIYDVMVREWAYAPELFGVPPFDGSLKPPQTTQEWQLWRQQAKWNPEYYPYFWRDIWPILQRPNNYQWVMDFDSFTGGNPHDTTADSKSNFDPNILSVPPQAGQTPEQLKFNRERRRFIHAVLRQSGEENRFTRSIAELPGQTLIGMPELCGDNPLSNTAASKFLRLTDTMLFLLKQWAEGKFVNERCEDIQPPPLPAGEALDRGVLSNLLGGAFCPGGEVCWIVRNPAIYARPFRIKRRGDVTPGALRLSAKENGGPKDAYDISQGLEPGDLTKYDALPWQADFNECSTQDIDITYEDWNAIYPDTTGDPIQPVIQTLFWWPMHRPMYVISETGRQVPWSGNIPQGTTGDLMMVTAWTGLSFVVNISDDQANPQYTQIFPNNPA